MRNCSAMLLLALAMTSVRCGPDVADDLYPTPCATADDCQSEERCSSADVCEPRLGIGGQCALSDDCAGDLQCVTASQWKGSLCTTECATECPGTAVCSDGNCFAPCATDADCFEGVACSDGLCGRVFDEPWLPAQDAKLHISALTPAAVGAEVAIRLKVENQQSLVGGGWDIGEASSSAPSVLMINSFEIPDIESSEWPADIYATAISAGVASVTADLVFEGMPLDATLRIETRDIATFELEDPCASRLLTPGPTHVSPYVLRDASGEEIYGDIAPLVSIQQTAQTAPAEHAWVGQDGIRFVPQLGVTTVSLGESGSQELEFLPQGALDQLSIRNSMVGDRSPGEFGVARVTFNVKSNGTDVCVENPDTIEWVLVSGTDCEAHLQERGDGPLDWQVDNFGPEGCTVAFSIKGSAAESVLVETP